MDNRILADLLAKYEKTRAENEKKEAARREEIAEKCPELAQLARARHEMVMQSVRSAFGAGTPADIEERMAQLNAQIADGLKKAGYPADYLAPIHDCPECEDTGFVYVQSVQTPCQCLKKAYAAAAAKAGQEGTATESFENFDESRFPDEPLPGHDVTQRQYMRLVRDKCRNFAGQLPDGPRKTLLLHGGSGLGKTYLLRCVERAARDRGVGALYTTAYDLLMRLRDAYFSRGDEGAEEYFSVPLLLIDDLGMEPLMETITVEQIYHLLNARLEKGLCTAITTNLSRPELKNRYTERVTSRLLDIRGGEAIPFLGKDIRLIRE